MKTKLLLAILLMPPFFTKGVAQTFDKAKIEQFLDRISEKNKGMGSLILARDGNVIYNRSFGYSQIKGNNKKALTADTKYRIDGQILPSDSKRRQNYHRADPVSPQRHTQYRGRWFMGDAIENAE